MKILSIALALEPRKMKEQRGVLVWMRTEIDASNTLKNFSPSSESMFSNSLRTMMNCTFFSSAMRKGSSATAEISAAPTGALSEKTLPVTENDCASNSRDVPARYLEALS